MEPILAVASGLVFGCAVYALLRRNFLRIVIGFMLISNAINLTLFAVGRLTRGGPPIVPHHAHGMENAANPLPQALILTAIVISFGITAFAFTLAYRVHKSLGTLDTDLLTEMERDACPPPEARAEGKERHLPA